MSIGVIIDVPAGRAGRRLAQIRSDLSPQYVTQAMAQGALPVAQRHLVGNAQRERNPFGMRSTFWMRMHAGTRAYGDGDTAVLAMPREVAQRYFGGTITPKAGRKWITIPARAEAYGKSARQFNDLRFVADKEGGAMLVQNDQTVVKTKRGRVRKDGTRKVTITGQEEIGGVVMYWLRRSVTQQPNHAVLPTERELTLGAMRGARALVAATLAAQTRNGGGAS